MTSKEKMSEYLLRLQQWQRMSLGIIDISIFTFFNHEGLVIHIIIGETLGDGHFDISENNSQEKNKITMRDISDYLHKRKVI